MARTRKPTNILQLKGGFKSHADRARARANEPTPLGPLDTKPPSWLTEAQRVCYTEIMDTCHPDVLSTADATVVQLVACLTAEFRENPGKMPVARMVRLMTGLGMLGMTPADRSKVAGIGANRRDSPYAKFASR